MPSQVDYDYRYYETALTGSAGAMTKDAMARRALDLLDRVNRAISIHSLNTKQHESFECSGCGVEYPCPTIRSLTGV